MPKKYDNLSLADDFMFSKVMRNSGLCKTLIEIVLDVKIEKIEYPEYQKTISLTKDSKGIRLDVYVSDDNNTMYDLEMQAVTEKYLPQRSRYYQDLMDLDFLEKGDHYRRLNQNIVIFICKFDLFRLNYPVYTFTNRCKENNSLELGDGTMKVFVNASYKGDNISPQMKNLLSYIDGNGPSDEYTKQLEEAVCSAKTNEEWRLEYMTYETRLMDRYEDGLEDGRVQGQAQGQELVAQNLIKAGELSIEKIALYTGVDIETLKKFEEE